MINSIKKFIKHHALLKPNTTIVIGLSGGPDSVALLYILHELSKEYTLKLIAAHLDHEWRVGSEEDAKFCQELCGNLGVPLIVTKGSEIKISAKFNGSQEEMGRLKRRAFFEAVAKKYNADAIALAHHAQDQQETFLIRMIRGTTLSGLIGMRPKAGKYIRPLLETNKDQLIAYLQEKQQPYLIDPTNLDEKYLRNKIRVNVLPALLTTDKRFDQNFLSTLHSLQETEQFLEQLTHKAFHEISDVTSPSSKIDSRKLLALPPYLRNRVIMFWLIKSGIPFTPSKGLLNEIIRFIGNQKGNEHTLYQKWTIIKDKGFLSITT